MVDGKFLEAVRAHNNSQALFNAMMASNEDNVATVITVVNKKNPKLNDTFKGHLPLEYAIETNKTKLFIALAECHPPVGEVANLSATVVDDEKKIAMSLLHYAASLGRSLIVKFLLSKGVDQTTQDRHGLLPIHYAAQSGDCATVDALNSHQQAINAVSRTGEYALHFAVKAGKMNVVTHLLGLGADVNCRDKFGRTPLHLAAKNNLRDMVVLLLKQKNTSRRHMDYRGRNAFHFAVEGGNSQLAFGLVSKAEKFSKPDAAGMTAMHIATERSNIEMLKYLKGRDGLSFLDKDIKGRMPLHIAAQRNLLEMFNFLVDELGQKSLMSFMDEAGDTVIEYAIRGKAHAILQRLKELGVNFNRTNKLGCTPMHEVAKGQAGMMNWLNSLGVGYSSKNSLGRAPVHIAAEFGQLGVLETLRWISNDYIQIRDAEGMHPIHVACFSGQCEAVKWFVENRFAQLSDVDNKGRDCLWHAKNGNQDKLVSYILNINDKPKAKRERADSLKQEPDIEIRKPKKATAEQLEAKAKANEQEFMCAQEPYDEDYDVRALRPNS